MRRGRELKSGKGPLGYVQSEGDIHGMLRRPPELLKQSSENLLAVFHQESRWEEQGGWRSSSRERRQQHRMERDASMVQLLNLLDPDSLIDNKARKRDDDMAAMQSAPRGKNAVEQQHSSLSRRGILFVGTSSALAWYLLRLVLRDRLQLAGAVVSARRRNVLELHALSALHAAGWVVFLLKKLRDAPEKLPEFCSRALVASLGFYLHDCWALRGTLLENPAMFAHQATMAATITSILRSKGVAWLAPPLMSLAIPTLVQELLQLCGTLGLPATRPEVRGLRLLWFASFAISKLALVPLWLRHNALPELHQPNLLLGKASYLASLVLNLRFMFSAARNLPRFLRPAGDLVPLVAAYRIPLKGMQAATTTVAAGMMLGGVFASYLTGPAAAVLALLASRRKSRGLRILAGVLCSAVAIDQLTPMPQECAPGVRMFMPLLKKLSEAFHHRFYPNNNVETVFRRDRHYMLAVTPHGFFPWGVAMIILDLLRQGYLPNFVGASVLGALPFAGRLLKCFGYRPATPAEIKRCLKKPYPRNVTIIVPGGIREMFLIRRDVEQSAANLRMGFVKLAKEHGAMLVPAYMFGNSQLYEVAKGSLGSLFENLSRKMRTSVNLFHGLWGTMLPYPQKLACALGEPIDTRDMDDEQAIHDLWVARLRDTFNKNKAEYGWPDRELFFEGETLPPKPSDPMEDYTALPNLSKL
mmetsp:Transcript_16922/g.43105  ORF Transcript_16922/g.43105 Transcript_16922/m.43105 type:complete len:699 (+) Transcript_16922:62-2158(+)